MKVIAFAASSSKQSINKQLATYAASLVENAQLEVLDLNDYELPLFSVDKEQELGKPALAQEFFAKIAASDAVIISFAEHNGSYTAAYKNIFDWCSRINQKIFQGKPIVLLATSPGPGGAASVLAAAVNSAPFFGGELRGYLSVPSFHQNFDVDQGCITNPEIQAQLAIAVKALQA
ncbi:MAG: NAD(P)H-dependent oxidoreductase [Methyloprofundus sp.]|nr:NAD(P)H-dependent oxidoreductase [Methyloprofundus sp.]MBW6452932.1 NAD(P)H-dependent oxidoreductase [Methyloprofundus sp.]